MFSISQPIVTVIFDPFLVVVVSASENALCYDPCITMFRIVLAGVPIPTVAFIALSNFNTAIATVSRLLSDGTVICLYRTPIMADSLSSLCLFSVN